MAGKPGIRRIPLPTAASRRLSRPLLRARAPADGRPSADGERRAVFFDRDGTLNEEVGYVNHPLRFQLYPFASQAVREVNQAGLLAIVVTNQSGVARGLFAESLVKKVHRQLSQTIQAAGGRLDRILYCPHHPQARLKQYRVDCSCRKPAVGMLENAAAQFGINLTKSFVVGDRYVDVHTAHRAGARGVLVLTGYGLGEWEYQRAAWQQAPDHVAENAYEAVRWILRNV